jgi:plastocyanin
MIRSTLRTFAIVAGLLSATLAAGGLLGAATPVAAATQHQIQIAGFAFQPGNLTIQAGDTVTWTNADDSPHTVTAENGAFDSRNLDQGAAFSFTFAEPGTYTYRCEYHSEMQATIVVEAAPAAPAQPAQPAPSTGGTTTPQTAPGDTTGGSGATDDQPDTALPAPWSIPSISLVLAGFGLLSFAIAFLPRRGGARIAVQRQGGGWRR